MGRRTKRGKDWKEKKRRETRRSGAEKRKEKRYEEEKREVERPAIQRYEHLHSLHCTNGCTPRFKQGGFTNDIIFFLGFFSILLLLLPFSSFFLFPQYCTAVLLEYFILFCKADRETAVHYSCSCSNSKETVKRMCMNVCARCGALSKDDGTCTVAHFHCRLRACVGAHTQLTSLGRRCQSC